ncbi:MAG: hypothetical protein Q9217_001766 [Psora testacea]
MDPTKRQGAAIEDDVELSISDLASPSDLSIVVKSRGKESTTHRETIFHVSRSEAEVGAVVDFSDDEPKALVILLNIAHLRFSVLPETLTFHELLDVSVLCDKYDTIRLVRPWAPKWVEPLTPTAYKPGYEEWLFIAWTFGDEATFSKLSKNLVLTIQLIEGDVCANGAGQKLGDTIPPGALDAILHARNKTLRKLLKSIDNVLQPYYTEDIACTALYQQDRACDAVGLGSLVQGLCSIKMWPLPAQANSLQTSVEVIGIRLKKLGCFSLNTGHRNCGFQPAFAKTIEHILSDTSDGVLPSHRQHMAEQRKK